MPVRVSQHYNYHNIMTIAKGMRIARPCQKRRAPLITEAPFTAASNAYIVNVGGQSSILSPGSNVHLINNT